MMPEWISVKDRLPEPGNRVLAASAYFTGECWMAVNGTWYRYNGYDMDNLFEPVTHWMMLPDPPKEDDLHEF